MRAELSSSVRRTVVLVLAVAGAAGLAACGGGSPAAGPAAPSKDYEAEARSTIDEKNMDAELERLKREVEADSK